MHFNNNNIGIFIGLSEKISILLTESLAYYIMVKLMDYHVYDCATSDILETITMQNYLF